MGIKLSLLQENVLRKILKADTAWRPIWDRLGLNPEEQAIARDLADKGLLRVTKLGQQQTWLPTTTGRQCLIGQRPANLKGWVGRRVMFTQRMLTSSGIVERGTIMKVIAVHKGRLQLTGRRGRLISRVHPGQVEPV